MPHDQLRTVQPSTSANQHEHRAPTGAAAVVGEAFDLLPGAVAVELAGDRFRTLLGSLCQRDPDRPAAQHRRHVPHRARRRPDTANARNTAYGAPAMTELFARVQQLGINPVLCQAYVFGGSNMFPNVFQRAPRGGCEWPLGHGFPARAQHAGAGQQPRRNGYRKISWTVGPREPVVEFVVNRCGNRR